MKLDEDANRTLEYAGIIVGVGLILVYLLYPAVFSPSSSPVTMKVVITDTSGVQHVYTASTVGPSGSIVVNGYAVSSIAFYGSATPTFTGTVTSASFSGSYSVSDTSSSVSLSGGSIGSTAVSITSGTAFYVPNPANGAVPVYSVSASALSAGSSGTYTLSVSLSVTLTAQISGNSSPSTVSGSASGSVTYSYSAGTLSALTVSVN